MALGVVLLLLGFGLLDRALERILKGQIDDYLRARTLALVHSREGTGLQVRIPELDLSLLRRRLVLRQVRIRFETRDQNHSQQFDAAAPRIILTGVDLTDAIWHRSLRLNGVAISAPVIYHLDDGPPDTGSAPGEAADTLPLSLPAADSLLYRVVAQWLPDEVRGGRVGTVRVDGATISSMLIRGAAVTVDSTAGLTLRMRGLQLDSARHRIFERATLSVEYLVHAQPGQQDSLVLRHGEVTISPDDTTFSIGLVRTGTPSSRHAVRAIGMRRSHARRMLTIDTLEYAPPVADSTYFRLAPPRSTRSRVLASNIRVLGLQQENLRRRRLTAGGVWIGNMEFDVLADRRVPGIPPRRILWPTRLARLDWVLGTDSAVIDSARVRYAEWTARSPRPATVSFDRLQIRLLRATNDTTVVDSLPLVIEGRGRLLDLAPFSTTIRVRVRPGPPRFTMEGEVGSMPITAFNSFLIPANGLEITDGKLERVRFAFEVANGKAAGRIRPTWQNLNLRMVDPVTRKQNLGQKLKSIVARMVSKDENMPDEQGRIAGARISYVVAPTDTFWGLIWRSLRSGLVRAMRG
jgi:hypothetical protein